MYQYNARILKVIDGDTCHAEVDLGFDTKLTMTIRLYGINAPETRTKDLAEKKKGLTAKEALRKKIEGKNVMITTYKDKKEKYGRYLADVFLYKKGSWETEVKVNLWMVEKGYAVNYYGEKR